MLQALRDPLRVFTDFVVKPPSYIVFREGDRYHVKSGKTGSMVFSNPDPVVAVQKAIDMAYGEGGGVVVLRDSYDFGKGGYVTLRSNVTLVGEGAVIRHNYGSPRATIYIPPGTVNAGVYRIRIYHDVPATDPGWGVNFAGLHAEGDVNNLVEDLAVVENVLEGDRAAISLGPWAAPAGNLFARRVYLLRNRVYHLGGDGSTYPVYVRFIEKLYMIGNYIRGRKHPDYPPRADLPGGVSMVAIYDSVISGNIIDGSNHNGFHGGGLRRVVIDSNVFLYTEDDAMDLNDSEDVVVSNNVAYWDSTGRGAIFFSIEGCRRILIVGNHITRYSMLAGSDSEDVWFVGNMGIHVGELINTLFGGLKRVFVVNNYYLADEQVPRHIYLHDSNGTKPNEDIYIEGNYISIKPPNSGWQWAEVKAKKFFFRRNVIDGTGVSGDHFRMLLNHDTTDRVIVEDNVFRNVGGHVRISLRSTQTGRVRNNRNLSSAFDGVGGQHLFTDYVDLGITMYQAYEGIGRAIAYFDATVAGAQTRTVGVPGHFPKLPPEFYVALCSIRSAPSGWNGYVSCKPNPSNPMTQVDVTLVTSTTATGSVEVEVVLMLAQHGTAHYYYPP
jgi:putative cofactor-binding repeat protein